MIPVRGSVRGRAWPGVTVMLIVMNIFVFFHEAVAPEKVLEGMIHAYGVVPKREVIALASQPERLDLWLWPSFTSMFLHAGWLHLGGNMLYLWVFGSGLESRFGHLRISGIYVVGGFLAAQTQVLADLSSSLPTIGASGAIAAILGAYLASYPRARITVVMPIWFWPLVFHVPAMIFLGIWFVQQIWSATSLSLSPAAAGAGGVAWWAHAGGFVTGIILSRIVGELPPEPRRGVRQWPVQ